MKGVIAAFRPLHELLIFEPNERVPTWSEITRHKDPMLVAARYMRWVNWYEGRPGGVDCAIKRIRVYCPLSTGSSYVGEVRFDIKKRRVYAERKR